MHGGEAMVMIIIFAGFFAMVFGIYYLRTRQNLAMIEKGMNPKQFINQPAPYRNLKWGLLLMGAGIGLLMAYLLDMYVINNTYINEIHNGNVYRQRQFDGNPTIYFALIAIGGGLGLFISYLMEKKWWDQQQIK